MGMARRRHELDDLACAVPCGDALRVGIPRTTRAVFSKLTTAPVRGLVWLNVRTEAPPDTQGYWKAPYR
jgi:hypothetical protein